MENSRFLKIVIVALLLLNLGTLSYLWMGRSGTQNGPHPPRQDVFSFLCRELQLDEQQVRKYEELRDEHHQGIEKIQHRGNQLREHFFDLLNVSPVDSNAVKQVADSIAATQKQIELITFYHFQKVRAILKPEQQKRFDEVIQDALRMMAPGGPPQGGPPPPPR